MNDETQDARIHYLYRITNTINGKIYIGQTVQPEKRWNQHKTSAASDNPKMIVSHAIKKYGNDAFEFEIIAGCRNWDDANEVETLLVSQYNSLVPNGYNVALGGFNAPKSEAWIQAMKDWHASLSPEKRAEISKKQSEATQQQIAEKGHPAQGLKWTDEQRANASIVQKAVENRFSPEALQLMSDVHKGKKATPEARKKQSVSATLDWEKRNAIREATGELKCNAPGCNISGSKQAYKMINGIRYCNKHGLRLWRYGRLDRINP